LCGSFLLLPACGSSPDGPPDPDSGDASSADVAKGDDGGDPARDAGRDAVGSPDANASPADAREDAPGFSGDASDARAGADTNFDARDAIADMSSSPDRVDVPGDDASASDTIDAPRPDDGDVQDAYADAARESDANDVTTEDKHDTRDAPLDDGSARSDAFDVLSQDQWDAPALIDAHLADVLTDSGARTDGSNDAEIADAMEGGPLDTGGVACAYSFAPGPLEFVEPHNCVPPAASRVLWGLYQTQRDGETFTVRRSGTLRGIETRLYRTYEPTDSSDAITLELFRCTAVDACDVTQAIAFALVPAASLPHFRDISTAPPRTAGFFDLSSSAIALHAGEIYLFVLTARLGSPVGNEFHVYGSNNDAYPSGMYWVANQSSLPIPFDAARDLSFGVFVSP
jgi:hypothetical protein